MSLDQTELLERIGKRLYWDKRTSMADVKVDIGPSVGSVIISGVVDSIFKKDAALELVENTDGVHFVEDQLSFQPGLHRSDEAIREIIEAEMKGVSWKKGEMVHVVVFGGVVKLTGTVHSRGSKAMAAGFCWELSGVRDCLNHILLVDEPSLAEAQLALVTQ